MSAKHIRDGRRNFTINLGCKTIKKSSASFYNLKLADIVVLLLEDTDKDTLLYLKFQAKIKDFQKVCPSRKIAQKPCL